MKKASHKDGIVYPQPGKITAGPVLTCSCNRFALLLNGILAAFFVIMGSFNGLVTLIGKYTGTNSVEKRIKGLFQFNARLD